MKKTIVALLALITLMGTASITTACSNNTKTEQAETHSAKKITKSEIKDKTYVGVSKDNKDQYISFFVEGNKPIIHNQVSKDGTKSNISYYMKKPAPKLSINKDNPKKFKISKGMNIMSKPEFHYNFKKVGKTTIQSTENKQEWKLYNGSQKSAIKHVQKQAQNQK